MNTDTDTSDSCGSILILADDLSGAAESAAAFLDVDCELSLDLEIPAHTAMPGIHVLDLDTRSRSAAAAAHRMDRAIAGVRTNTLIVKKIDSLLRGNIAAEIAVLAGDAPVIIAAGLPALRRTVAGGVVHVDGVPLHETNSWSAEDGSAPRSVGAALGGLTFRDIDTDDLAIDLARSFADGAVAVCDVRDDVDLDAIVAAAARFDGVRMVGTSALAAAIARTLTPRRTQTPRQSCDGVLVVVGTAESKAAEQVSVLESSGAEVVRLPVEQLRSGTVDPEPVCRALDSGVAVLTVVGHARNTTAVSAALARLVAAVARPCDLVLTGGETARRVIDALGITGLHPIGEIHHGAVVSATSDGRRIVTRPGSFGGADSLLTISDYLRGTGPFPLPFDSEASA